MSALSKPRYTPQQYLDMERVADHKSEFFSGEIIAMAGGSESHSLITVNISGELRTRLKNQHCRTFSSDMRVRSLKPALMSTRMFQSSAGRHISPARIMICYSIPA